PPQTALRQTSQINFVGWVERSYTHQFRAPNAWVSLRSTHPTKFICEVWRKAVREQARSYEERTL
ncbi:hypothetical protein, partial [Pseudomonas sp. Pseusp97]|uniref:hypothetical protein n=1 Tax=Pseudomonas sp. Pseusp97 TaxID=3243065 RepID=UPI0039A40544